MFVTLLDLEEALVRLATGELPYEFMTSDPQLRLLGPACGYGAGRLQQYRKLGLYAENLTEAQEMAKHRQVTVTGIWFVKETPRQRPPPTSCT
jgi:hypothetical protein